ncbi:MAG: hypothetical protein J3K34DRAFT_432169 [Monoraphidium minutum]|nr:MAG: hypothetical protein J3K34DRAFT_432169 [Monoraphidium minutum]
MRHRATAARRWARSLAALARGMLKRAVARLDKALGIGSPPPSPHENTCTHPPYMSSAPPLFFWSAQGPGAPPYPVSPNQRRALAAPRRRARPPACLLPDPPAPGPAWAGRREREAAAAHHLAAPARTQHSRAAPPPGRAPVNCARRAERGRPSPPIGPSIAPHSSSHGQKWPRPLSPTQRARAAGGGAAPGAPAALPRSRQVLARRPLPRQPRAAPTCICVS